jgi:hypothetical protein
MFRMDGPLCIHIVHMYIILAFYLYGYWKLLPVDAN